MVEAITFINMILIVMWIVFVIYVLQHYKSISINALGLTIAVSVLYPYIIYHDNWGETTDIVSSLQYEIVVCRYLVLASIFSLVHKSVVLNKQLNKMSKRNTNILKNK